MTRPASPQSGNIQSHVDCGQGHAVPVLYHSPAGQGHCAHWSDVGPGGPLRRPLGCQKVETRQVLLYGYGGLSACLSGYWPCFGTVLKGPEAPFPFCPTLLKRAGVGLREKLD